MLEDLLIISTMKSYDFMVEMVDGGHGPQIMW